MPKHTIDFSLPEERIELNLALNGPKYHCALTEYDQWLRSQIKHENHPEPKYDAFVDARNKLWDIIVENGLQDLYDT